MSTDSINHQRHSRSTKRTKCGKAKLPTYPLGTFRSVYQSAAISEGRRRKDQAKHQKAANIRANGLPLEVVDTKKRPQWTVIVGPKSIAARLGKLVPAPGTWKSRPLPVILDDLQRG